VSSIFEGETIFLSLYEKYKNIKIKIRIERGKIVYNILNCRFVKRVPMREKWAFPVGIQTQLQSRVALAG
jgi:hypothetical protein